MIERLFLSLLFTALLGALVLGAVLTTKALRTDGRITHCYVEERLASQEGFNYYRLVGNREWLPDLKMFQARDFDVAFAKAIEIGCPMPPWTKK